MQEMHYVQGWTVVEQCRSNCRDVRLSSCPMGAQAGSQRCVATFTKGITISFKLRLALTSCLNSETCIFNDYGYKPFRVIQSLFSEALFLAMVLDRGEE